jgi:hypothetical protein
MIGYSPTSTFPFANNALVVASQVWIMTTGDQFTYSSRIVVGFSGCSIICALLPYSTALLPIGANYWVTFVMLLIFGAFSGVAQGTCYAMAANMPFKYMGAVMLGNGICGILCNFLRAFTLLIFPVVSGDEELTKQNSFYSAIFFLSFGALLLFGSVVNQLLVLKPNPFFIYYTDWIIAAKERSTLDESEERSAYGLMT